MEITTHTTSEGVTVKIEFVVKKVRLTIDELKQIIEEIKERIEEPFEINDVDFFNEEQAYKDLKNILNMKTD